MYVYCCDTNDKQRFKWKRKKSLQAKNDLLIIDH